MASKNSLKIDLKRGFDPIKRKSKVKEETLTAKSSKIDQKPQVVSNCKEMLDFVNGIAISDDIKQKLEIKEEPIDMKSSSVGIKRKPEFMEEKLTIKSSKIDQKSDIVDPKMQNDKEMLDALHDIEFPNDTKPKFEIKIKTFDVKTTNYGASHDNYLFSQYSQLGASILPNALPTEAFTPLKGEIAVAKPSDETGTREWIFARQALQKIANERPNCGASNENYLFSQFGASVLPNVSPTESFTPSLISQEPPPR
jgi:hypothetical protein